MSLFLEEQLESAVLILPVGDDDEQYGCPSETTRMSRPSMLDASPRPVRTRSWEHPHLVGALGVGCRPQERRRATGACSKLMHLLRLMHTLDPSRPWPAHPLELSPEDLLTGTAGFDADIMTLLATPSLMPQAL
ncbi:hypothetical protein Q7P37_005550 [Cladosporium fusiforme]